MDGPWGGTFAFFFGNFGFGVRRSAFCAVFEKKVTKMGSIKLKLYL